MSLAEQLVRQQTAHTPEQYTKRVKLLAGIFFILDSISIGIMVLIAWRIQYFVIIAQRTNVETLTLAILFVLAAYYLVSTFGGFIGAIRILWYNLPASWARNSKDLEVIERRKQAAMKSKAEDKSAYFDKAVLLKGKPDEPIEWELKDEAGSIGTLTLDGVKATLEPTKEGISNSLFEFLASRIEDCVRKSDPKILMQITQWSTIDQDQASAYYSMVKAFQNLEKELGKKGPVWPAVELSESDVKKIEKELRELVPVLRSESFLPDVEYKVEYNVPILPEPLGLMKLTRSDNRADPIITMGCAGLVMLMVMAIIVLFIIFPPWVPPR